MRIESLRMLNFLLSYLHGCLKSSPPDQTLGVVDRIVKVDVEKRKILGLDAPLKIAQTDTEGNDRDFEPPTFVFREVTPEDVKEVELPPPTNTDTGNQEEGGPTTGIQEPGGR